MKARVSFKIIFGGGPYNSEVMLISGPHRLARAVAVRPAALNPAAKVEPAATDRVESAVEEAPQRVRPQTSQLETPVLLGDNYKVRAVQVPRLFKLARQLKNKELEGEDFQKAASQLMDIADRSTDKLTTDLAESLLIRHFKWKDHPTDWAMKLGTLKGPIKALEGMLGGIRNSGNWYTEESITGHLERLKHATQNYRAPEDAIAVLARGSRDLYRRAEAKLDPKIREHESPELDRKLAGECLNTIKSWHQRGDLAVLAGGEALKPEQLEEYFKGDHILEVWGRAINFAEKPPAPSKQLTEVLEQIPSWKDDPAPGLDRLEQLAQSQPQQAKQLAAEFVNLVAGNGFRDSRFERLLAEAPERPKLKALLQPHLGTLARAAELAVARDQQSFVPEYYEQLGQAFPEVKIPAVIEGQLARLEPSYNLTRLLRQWCDEKPELSESIAKYAFSTFDEPHQDSFTLLNKAADHGWKPESVQLQLIADRLVAVRDDEDRSMIRREYYEELAELGSKLQGWEKIAIPDSQGRQRPLREALLDHLLNDPVTDVRDFHPGRSLTRQSVPHYYKWLCPEPDRKIAGKLLKILEGAQTGTSLRKQSVQVQKAVTFLAAMPLHQEDEAKLAEFLRPYGSTDPGWYVFNEIVDRFRESVYEPEAIEALQASDLQVGERYEKAVDFVMLNQKGMSKGLEHEGRLNKGLDVFLELVKDQDPKSLTRLTLQAANRAVESTREHESTTDMPDRTKAELLVAGHLAAQDRDRLDRFLEAIKPLRDKINIFPVDDILDRIDGAHKDLTWRLTEREILTRPNLPAKVDGIVDYLANDPGRSEAALTCFEGLVDKQGAAARSGWMVQLLDKVLQGHEQPGQDDAYQAARLTMARRLTHGDEACKAHFDAMVDPLLLLPASDSELGQVIDSIRSEKIYRYDWPLSFDEKDPEKRFQLFAEGFPYAQAGGDRQARSLAEDFVERRDKELQHWTYQVFDLFPEQESWATARNCLAVGSSENLDLYFEIHRRTGKPTDAEEHLENYTKIRQRMDQGADLQTALREVIIGTLNPANEDQGPEIDAEYAEDAIVLDGLSVERR